MLKAKPLKLLEKLLRKLDKKASKEKVSVSHVVTDAIRQALG